VESQKNKVRKVASKVREKLLTRRRYSDERERRIEEIAPHGGALTACDGEKRGAPLLKKMDK